MTEITPFKDSACVRGTFRSVLTDAKCSNELMSEIMEEIEKRTTATNTEVNISEIGTLLRKMFQKSSRIVIKEVKDFGLIESIDNSTSFGMLFWNGDGKGNNHHATRFISKNETQVTFMDPQTGSIFTGDIENLFSLAPLGFDFIKLELIDVKNATDD